MKLAELEKNYGKTIKLIDFIKESKLISDEEKELLLEALDRYARLLGTQKKEIKENKK